MGDHTPLGENEEPSLLQQPSLSRTRIAFVFAGDLWIADRHGGDARRLTTHPGRETDPHFSPDGSLIAFTGEYDNNVDVYVVPAAGGVPRRLTYHPGYDQAVGWTPDGNQVLFASSRSSFHWRVNRLFTIPMAGALPNELPLPMAEEGSFSSDGRHLAYLPIRRQFFPLESGILQGWKRYRGGMTTPIWIADLADSSVEVVPRENSNDFNPMWVDHRIYFLSDRNGPVTLFVYDTTTRQVTQVLENKGLDLKSASAGPGGIVYEQFGSLHLYDIASGNARKLEIRVRGDLPEVRPQFKKVASLIRTARLSPTGAHAVFEARGEVLTVSAKTGEIRNLTNTPGVAERDPAWSPDGRWIAYFSDESGEYALHLREQTGARRLRRIALEHEPSFYYSPVWAPDGKKIAFTDMRLNLWYVDIEETTSGQMPVPTRVDTDPSLRRSSLDPVWSPDSRWLAYAKQLNNHMRAVSAHELETGKNYQLTDGMSDVQLLAFDKNGCWLYFTASTDIGPAMFGLEMSSFQRPVSRRVYAILCHRDAPLPVQPQAEGEQEGDPQIGQDSTPPGTPAAEFTFTRIDFEGVQSRIVALPIPPRNYTAMAAGKSGQLFLLEERPFPLPDFPDQSLYRFCARTRKTERVLEGIRSFALSDDGERLLYRQGDRWALVNATQTITPGEGALKLDAMEVRVDPRSEWRQIFHEVWRLQRDFFYDPDHHGLDLRAARRKYEPYLENLSSRADLNYLFTEMWGELSVGHLFVEGGDQPEVKRVPIGLLGADFCVENGRYRFARIYGGDPWNPELRAPLTEHGANVATGEYLLAVDGDDLSAEENVYKRLEGIANRSVRLRVGPDPSGSGSREITVLPTGSERELRQLAWIEENRRRVDELSGGRVAYVYLPDTYVDGYAAFNRYYFAQADREAVVIDERFNGGGMIPDHILSYLQRAVMDYWAVRIGKDYLFPQAAIGGPKVMIINQYAGSGGDHLPWLFRRLGLGGLIGKRTWGGLVGGTGHTPSLIDGGNVRTPSMAFYTPEGKWEIENHGVEPDIEVEFDPPSWRAGRDPQLEKAVEWVLKELEKHPVPRPRRPPYPNYHAE
jgi:tricorn protease